MLTILNPATEEILRSLPTDSPASIQDKFALAKASQHRWAKTPLEERKRALQNFAQKLKDHEDTLASTLSQEMGKPLSQARNELRGLQPRIAFFLEAIDSVLREEDVTPRLPGEDASAPAPLREIIAYEPLGVIADISAWNYPWFVSTNVVIPALLTGNTVLFKPSEYATLSGLAMVDLFHQSGIPKDVLLPVIGGGSVGAALLEQPLQGVFFTGSYATGLKVASAAARRLIRCQVELGGKDPAYVCEDADPAAAALSLADGAFYNTGQSCCSVERIYVHEAIFDRFLDTFLREVATFVVGDPADPKTYIGPLARKEQIAFLEAQVQDALSKGAKLLLGGKRLDGKGFYFEPTVFTHVDHSMDLMKEESFGPIIGIQKVSGDAEAIALMNDTAYGLTAGVYTSDAARARKILDLVSAGTGYWNCCDRVSPRLPWTGRQHSGLGSTLSHLGIRAFLQPKALHLKRP